MISDYISSMVTGEELDNNLKILPYYDPKIRKATDSVRLIALQDLYKIYIPNQMAHEVYSKLYLSLVRSLSKKESIEAIKQSNENHKSIKRLDYTSIIGGSDSFVVIAPSGAGKSATVSRCIRIISKLDYFIFDNTKIIPFLTIQTPADASLKSLMFEILRKTDEFLDSKYYSNAIKARATLDILIGTVSQVCLQHIGVIVLDEIEFAVSSKNSKSIVGTLTQLINNSGISICMIGTPETEIFFSSAMMLARRSLGLIYDNYNYNSEYMSICNSLMEYIYVKETDFNDKDISMWLYNHSNGNISITISLFHDAQELAIINKYEKLDIKSLSEAYDRHYKMLHQYITPKKIYFPNSINNNRTDLSILNNNVISLTTIMENIKLNNENIVSGLRKNNIDVIEVSI